MKDQVVAALPKSLQIKLNIQRNTTELLKENRALRTQYEELQKSLDFHIGKLESLEMENNKLKQEVSSIKKQFVRQKMILPI